MGHIKPEALGWADATDMDVEDALEAAAYLNAFTLEERAAFVDAHGEFSATALAEDIENNAPASAAVASEFAIIAGEKWGLV